MKNSKSILEEIKSNAAKIEELNNFVRSAKYSERTAPEIVKAAEDTETLKVINAILYDNARQALFAEVMPIIIEVFNKYSGKAYGPKTKDKINSEIKARANCAVYVDTNYYCSALNIVPLNDKGFSGTMFQYNSFEIFGEVEDGKRIKFISDDNKINAIDINKIYLSNCAPYEDLPKKKAAAIIASYAKVKKAHSDFEKIISEFNSVCPSRIDHISTSNYRNYLFR